MAHDTRSSRDRDAGESSDGDLRPDGAPFVPDSFVETIEGSAPSAPVPLAAADAIPGYRILRELHRGAQGIVYLALQVATQRNVALKVVREGPFAGPEDLARFQREARVLAQLDHPHIVTIHDSGEVAGLVYLVMDYLAGEALDAFIRSGPHPIAKTLHVFLGICDAVGAAHRRGIVHRDLKPSNVRFDAAGDPRVLDFGLAKLPVGGDTAAGAVTRTGQFLGSLPWAAPEQAEAAPAKIDVRTDVYALGVVLYQMLTGGFPYVVSGNMRDVLDRILHAEPTPPRRLRRDIDADLQTLVLTCLAKERARRYSSAVELADDVRHYLAGEPLTRRRDSTTYVLRKRARLAVRRHPWAARLVAGVAALLVAWTLHATGWGVALPDRALARLAQGLWQAPAGARWHDDVRVIALTDATCDALPRLAAELALPGVRQDQLRSWRQVHGKLMERLAVAGPRVIAWDIIFSGEDPDSDAGLVAGMRAAQSADIPVVLGVNRVDAQGRPVLSERIRAQADGWGWIQLERSEGRVRGALLLVSHPPAPPTPSLSLATFAAACGGGAPLYTWNPALNVLEIHVLEPARPGVRAAAWRRDVQRVRVAAVLEEWAEGVPPGTDVSARDLAHAWTVLPPADELARRTTPYHEVFALRTEELRAKFGGRIVLIGDNRMARTTTPDRSWTEDGTGGRLEFHVYTHAQAVCELLRGRPPIQSGLLVDAAFLTAAVLAGLLVGAYSHRRPRVGIVCAVAAMLMLVVLSLGVARFYRQLVAPGSAVAGLWLSVFAGYAVQRAAAPRDTAPDSIGSFAA